LVAADVQPAAPADAPQTFDLQTAITYALTHNLAIQQAREQIKQQEGVILEVSAQALPTVTAGGDYSRNETSISSNPSNPSDRNWGLKIQATQLLYSGGNVTAARTSANLLRSAAALELEGVVNDQLLAVRTSFYNVLLAREKIGVQEQNITLLQKQLKDAENRLDAGTASSFEVLRAKVALANGRPDLITARNDYRNAIEELRRVIGLTESPDQGGAVALNVEGLLDVSQRADYDLRDALNSARAHRPELLRLAKLEQANEQGVTVARAGYRPTASLFANYQWNKGFGLNGWDNRQEGWMAGVQTQWNIFDGRATAGRVAQAQSGLRQSKLAFQDATLAIDVEVRRAYSGLTEAGQLLDASGQTVDQATEALRLANVRYNAGTATQLDVLTSQVDLTRARLNQLQASYNYHVALASLRKAIGQADTYVSG
jgi:outer membrane protein TolC